MRRPTSSALIALIAVLLLTACTRAEWPLTPAVSDGASWVGFPTLPQTVGLPQHAPPPLPETGPIGRGALLYAGPAGVTLVLESGTAFLLPPPPAGEGRQGVLWPTLSPTGRWLGHRRASFVKDPVYLVRDLGGTGVTSFEGTPQAWSADGRFLLARAGDTDVIVVEPATGAIRHLGDHQPGALLAGGQPIEWPPGDRVGGVGPQDECWCPAGPSLLSPDGARVSTLVAYDRGLIPGTDQKSPAAPGHPVAVLIRTRDTGAHLALIHLPVADDGDWRLAADTGDKLLLVWRTGDAEAPRSTLMTLIPPAGEQHQLALDEPAPAEVAVLPTDAVALPGQVLYTGE